MRRKLVFVFGLIVSEVLFCGPLAADLVVPKFVPELRVNKKAEVCEPLLRSWQSVYASTKFLRLTKKQLATAFGIRKVRQVGGHRTPQLFSKDLDGVAVDGYRAPQSLTLDLDGDEIEEHLLVSTRYRGLRYQGTAVYLFRDAAHRDEVAEYSEERRKDLRRLEGEGYEHGGVEIYYGVQLRLVAVRGITYFVTLLSAGDLSALWQFERDKEQIGEITLLCEVQIRPDSNALEQLVKQVDLLELLQPTHGEPGKYGSLARGTKSQEDRSASLPGRLLHTLLYRPQTLVQSRQQAYAKNNPLASRNTRTELRLILWALKDPASWSRYLEVQAELPKFLNSLARYYRTEYGVDESVSDQWAEDAYHYFMGALIYRLNSDRGHNLVTAAHYPQSMFQFGPAPDLCDAANKLYASWLARIREPALPADQRNKMIKDSVNFLHELILLATYSGISVDEIADLWRSLDNQKPDRMDRFNSRFLAASIHRPKVLEFFLNQGLDPDSSTNDSKTTALMYAAEYAHTPALQRLQDAGADICAKDSQENDLGVYASRNAVDNSVPTWVASRLKSCTTNAAQ